jgi:hypothetical protein
MNEAATKILNILENNHLPKLPQNEIPLDVSYKMNTGDWYVKTENGWFGLSPGWTQWRPCPLGPL